MANTFKFGAGEWYGKKDTILAYNDENKNYKPLPFTFSRDSTGTIVNENGLIETVGIDEPRVDYLDNANGHLLLEPQRRNIMTDSELSTTSINTHGDGSSSDVILSNGLSGKEFTITSSGRVFFVFTATVVSGTQYTISAFVEDYTGIASSNFIDIFAGGSGDFSSDLIENGRMEGTFTATSTSVTIRIGLGNTTTYSGAFSAKISGIQLEDAGSGNDATYATSYIPTNGETNGVTRSADVCEGAGNDQVFNSEEGVLYANIQGFSSDTARYSISDGSNNNNIYIELNSTNISAVGRLSGVNQFALSSTQTITNTNKVAILYKQNDFRLFINGTKVATDTSGGTYSANTINSLQFNRGDGGVSFYGNVKDLRVYDTALTDAELATLTQV